jgi:tRNA(Arg) A34 adenosine deaminase TadA
MQATALEESFIRAVNQLALEAAKQGFDPFAAILVREDKVLASTGDKCIQYSDPTAHAELILMSEYCRQEKLIDLEGYTLYCNVEPCVMCSGAIHWARISRVVFSVSQSMLQTVSKGNQKPKAADLINTGGKTIAVLGPVLAQEGLAVLEAYPFQSKKEKHRRYHGSGFTDQ